MECQHLAHGGLHNNNKTQRGDSVPLCHAAKRVAFLEDLSLALLYFPPFVMMGTVFLSVSS